MSPSLFNSRGLVEEKQLWPETDCLDSLTVSAVGVRRSKGTFGANADSICPLQKRTMFFIQLCRALPIILPFSFLAFVYCMYSHIRLPLQNEIGNVWHTWYALDERAMMGQKLTEVAQTRPPNCATVYRLSFFLPFNCSRVYFFLAFNTNIRLT